jgi:hypothetical protein
MSQTIVLLGRNGDIINLLPLAYYLSQNGGVQWVVSAHFSPIFEGCSYVRSRNWPGHPETLDDAAACMWENQIVAQCYKNPDQEHLTESYTKESWRLAGFLHEFGHWPLVFDQRDPDREDDLIFKHIKPERKNILVATKSISSPFPKANLLIAKLRGLDANVIDLDNIHVEHVYDLLGLFDRADCLVTVDTMHLHLARASYCPVVACINEGWLGSSLPPQHIAAYRYSYAAECLDEIVETVDQYVNHEAKSFCLVADIHGHSARHERARKTWPKDTVVTHTHKIPKFQDVLRYGLLQNKDVTIWTNDDVGFVKGAFHKIMAHASKFPFGCTRRDKDHIGRECFWFRTDWLQQHIDEMPDVYIATPKFDLIIARHLRKLIRIPTTFQNLKYDFAPVELPHGLVRHEHHKSSWLERNDAETSWNERIWNES